VITVGLVANISVPNGVTTVVFRATDNDGATATATVELSVT
jgi:hypothetical protein